MKAMAKKMQCVLLTGVMLLSSFSAVNAKENDTLSLYVDTHAEQSGNGSFTSPYKTVFEAQEAVRKLIADGKYPNGGITVYLREGQYVLDSTFSFDERDSGTEDAPVTWRSYYGENATLTTGSSIPFSDFTEAEDDRIRDEVQGKIYKINLKENGYHVHDGLFMLGHVQHYFWMWGMAEEGEPWKGSPNPLVMMGDEIGTLARYPNEGYLTTGRVLSNGNVDDGMWYENDNVGHKIEGEIKGFIMEFNDDRIKTWKNAKDAWLYGRFRYDWSDYQVKVKNIDVENKTIETTHPCNGKLVEGREAWYILNLLEELDAPGEWFCDTETGDLFIYPTAGLKKSDTISLSFTKTDILSFKNAENIVVRDLTLTSTRANCLKTSKSNNIKFQYLEICNTAGDVMNINGTNIKVQGCHIYNTGANLGEMTGYGGDNELDLIPSGNSVENCWIHDLGRVGKNGNFTLAGVGAKWKNNLSYNIPSTTLTLGGNDCVVEDSEFHDCLTETSDAGVIYSVNHVTLCGNVIRNNVIHDIQLKTNEKTESVHAIYLDNYTSAWEITNNVIYDVSGFGIFINMGHANTVTNNIIANARKGVYANMGRFDQTHPEDEKAYALEDEMLTNPAWEKYPHIKEMTEPDWWHGRMNYVDNNLCYNVSENALMVNCLNVDTGKILKTNTFKEGMTVSGTKDFVAADKNNYNIKADSKILDKMPDLKNTDMNIASTVTSQIKRAIGDNAICFLKGSPAAYVNFEKYLINSDNMGVTAFDKDGVTYVPIRFIKEHKNGAVEWNKGEITIDFEGTELKLYPSQKKYFENGTERELQNSIVLIDGTSYISTADYAEIFGSVVTDFENGLVIIAQKDVGENFTEDMLEDLCSRLK